MNALTCAEAKLHDNELLCKGKEVETSVVSALCHAMRVAHASCEAALTRVERMYDADLAACDADEFVLCKEMAESAVFHASTFVSALEYASTQSSLSVELCSDTAMRAAIDAESMGAVSLGVVLLSEFNFVLSPRGLFLYVLRHDHHPSAHMLRVLLSSSVLVAQINDCTDSQHTALMIASRRGLTEAVTALLACSAVRESAGAVNKHGFSALMLASRFGHSTIVSALLACPAVVASANDLSFRGYTVLMLAATEGHVQVFHALLACPAVIASAGVSGINGDTALMIAATEGHVQVVHALLACPTVIASAGMSDINGCTALMLAATEGHIQVVKAL
jgi:hypothetical protein